MSNKKEIYFYYKKLLSFLERWQKQMKKKKKQRGDRGNEKRSVFKYFDVYK